MTVGAPSSKGFRFPPEIVSHCVWLYYRFPLSFREVQEMMLQRWIVVSHETIRQWCVKFGKPTPTGCVAVGPGPAIRGTSTRYSSRSTVSGGTCGAPSTRTGMSWTFWSPLGGTPRPRPGSFASCSRAWSTRHGLVVTDI